jgi:hypothetical protein
MVGELLRPYQSLASYRSREAVRSVAQQTAPGDRWIIFNAQEKVPYAPYLGDWRGVGGQFVFDVLRFKPVPIAWAPPPETIQAAPGRRVWLLVYRAENEKKGVDFPDEQLAAYVATMAVCLGPPGYESYVVKDERGKLETVDAYRFGR